ncbi:MAG: hypothetical protein ACNS62_05160 [Candidatus Cyclobacteriaceae bacterium M3_2C_046]
MKNLNCIFYILSFIFLAACEPEIESEFKTGSGSLDFNQYIAVGNSLTAGYSNSALYREGQLNAYPALIAKQLAEVKDITFEQPLMPPGNGSGPFVLKSLNFNDIGIPTPVITKLPASPDAFDKVSGDFNNLGIPGFRAKDITVNGIGSANVNPYFARILPSGQEMTSYLELVQSKSPTFFTCWIGNNDVLGYASTGGKFGIEGEGELGLNGLTSPSQFLPSYTALVEALTEDGGKGILITIPDIINTPLFTTIPNALIPIPDQATADALNAAYAAYNSGVELYNAAVPSSDHLNKIQFSIGLNYPVVEDQSIPDISQLPKFSQLNAEGLLLLNLPLQRLFQGWGTAAPIPDEYVLTATEVKVIKTYTDQYNTIINRFASNDIAILDSDQILGEISQGKFYDGISVNSSFISGGVFSLDGIHLTPLGNAILANEIIKKINTSFDAAIPTLLVNQFQGVPLP